MEAAVANSFMVSADNAHAIHPAHPGTPIRGVSGAGRWRCHQYNANQRYTTDTVSAAVFQSICRRDVPVQRSNRADLPGGSTWEYLHSALLRSHGGHRPAPACHAQRLRNSGAADTAI
ncbi:MAG: hypothetical protein ACLTGT_05655 [Oscillospiraceae bacterium]